MAMPNPTTEDPNNKPEYAEVSDRKWKELSESTRKTIINSLNDPVSVRAYLRFEDLFHGYQKVREKLLEMTDVFYPESDEPAGKMLPDFMQDLLNSIDPMSTVLWRDVDNRIQELKEARRESLERLLQKSVNRTEAHEIREDILDEIDKLDG